MLICSKEAFARCPTARLCGRREESTFTEGSECDRFNQAVERKQGPKTIADSIREMVCTNEGIAKILMQLDITLAEDGKEFTELYCHGDNDCVDGKEEIICTEEMRTACILRWLRQPVTQTTADDEPHDHSGLVTED